MATAANELESRMLTFDFENLVKATLAELESVKVTARNKRKVLKAMSKMYRDVDTHWLLAKKTADDTLAKGDSEFLDQDDLRHKVSSDSLSKVHLRPTSLIFTDSKLGNRRQDERLCSQIPRACGQGCEH